MTLGGSKLLYQSLWGVLPDGFKITATCHSYPIPEDMYALLPADLWMRDWVIGQRLPAKRFAKVSVLDIPDGEESIDLHITKRCRNIPV